MNVVPYTNFLPYVIPYVMGCSEPLALQAIRDVCIRFAENTLILNQTLDPVSTVPGITNYDLDAGSGKVVQLITHAWLNRNRLEVIDADSLSSNTEMFNSFFIDADKQPGQPTALMQNADHSFTLNRVPAERERNAITIRAATKPSRLATMVENLLFEDYAFDIGQGAIAYLMMIPNEPFSNPALAPVYEGRYLHAQHLAKIRANKGLGRVNVQVKFRRQ